MRGAKWDFLFFFADSIFFFLFFSVCKVNCTRRRVMVSYENFKKKKLLKINVNHLLLAKLNLPKPYIKLSIYFLFYCRLNMLSQEEVQTFLFSNLYRYILSLKISPDRHFSLSPFALIFSGRIWADFCFGTCTL
jgi:hypothetical protein